MEIIAEIGQNHNGDIDLACEMIRVAKKNGADVAKFQLYDARKLFPKEGNEWFDYNCRTEISKIDLKRLNDECKKVKIEFMASVFDIERISWLEDINVRRHKVASRSIKEKAMIDALCQTKKDLLVSLGMWDGKQFPEIKTKARVEYLYCISKYPTPLADVHLRNVDFNRYAGFSDHTIGISSALAALSRGARIIEKHFTLDKNAYGPDHSGSMTPDELKTICQFRDELKELL